ncbi:MAG: roadblock/LC7 domain-containing protein [Candidatus Omnitrophica bacterium]|nr:roadblock/LC7 domain-containing protein [Candidatus Omnitrophota bacterium]
MIDRMIELQKSMPEIEAAAVVSLDGLIIASALPAEISADRVSAMSAAILSLAESISNEMGRGSLEQVFTKGALGYVILTTITDQAGLTVLASQQAKPGLVFLEMRRAADDLVKLL